MNRRLLHIIEWLVAIAAYAWLAYSLATYDRYDDVAASLRAMDWTQWTALALAVALMPLNMLLEAWKWQTLMPMPLREAQRQVYYSKLAGLITPWRLGEYPARALLFTKSQSPTTRSDLRREGHFTNPQSPLPTILSMGAVGSATMTAAIVVSGLVALTFSPAVRNRLGDSYLFVLIVVVVLLAAALLLAPKILKRWADVSNRLVWTTTLQSFVRLACWCLQLALVLYALNAFDNSQLSIINYQFSIVNSQFSTLLSLPIYYLLVTVTPNIPIVEAGVRGAWAMFLFGSVNAALAGVLLWAINTLLPCLCWLFVRK